MGFWVLARSDENVENLDEELEEEDMERGEYIESLKRAPLAMASGGRRWWFVETAAAALNILKDFVWDRDIQWCKGILKGNKIINLL